MFTIHTNAVAEKLEVQSLIEPEPELLIEKFGQYLDFMARIARRGSD